MYCSSFVSPASAFTAIDNFLYVIKQNHQIQTLSHVSSALYC